MGKPVDFPVEYQSRGRLSGEGQNPANVSTLGINGHRPLPAPAYDGWSFVVGGEIGLFTTGLEAQKMIYSKLGRFAPKIDLQRHTGA